MITGNLRNILLHITGSIAFLVLPFLFSPDVSRMGLTALWNIVPMQRDLLLYLLLLGFFYFNYFLLIPRLYFPKKYVWFIIAVLVCYVMICKAPGLVIHDRPERVEQVEERRSQMMPPPDDRMPAQELQSLIDPRHFFLFLFVLSLSLVLQINNKWKRTEKEKLQAELSVLKAQINPHFLFNSLNSIYSLALDRSEYTAGAIVKLSDMMRHVINEAGHHLVDLGGEINYILDYIELQSIRFTRSIELDVKVTGNSQGKKIAPLILISFVENAFKHGVNPDEPSPLRIHIHIEQYTLRMEVFNHKVRTTAADSGTGLENTMNRLQLLYPGKHLLTIRDTAQNFYISLTLQIE